MRQFGFRSNETTFTTVLATVLFDRGHFPTCEKQLKIGGMNRKPDLLVFRQPTRGLSFEDLLPWRDRRVHAMDPLGAYEVKVTGNTVPLMRKDIQKLAELDVPERALLILNVHWPYQFERQRRKWAERRAALPLDWLEPQTAECSVDVGPPYPKAFAVAGFLR